MISFESMDFQGKRVLVRVDFNVPLNDNSEVADDTRIQAALPTILAILKKGGKVILMSHFGRPDGIRNLKYSLLPVANRLKQLIDNEVIFAEDCIGDSILALSEGLKTGSVLLLENLRFYKEETAGNENFAEQLSKLGDIYVNDAFGTAHRAHASTSIIAKYFKSSNRCFGLLMGAEIDNLKKALVDGHSPKTAIIGGAKVSSKIDVLKSLITKVDRIIIGGGMAYTFIKANGGSVGNSLVEDDKLSVAKELVEEAKNRGVELILPLDSVNGSEFKDQASSSVTDAENIPDCEMGLDIGDRTISTLKEVIKTSNTIIWNGPMGVFEFKNFENGTKKIGEFIVEATKNGAYSLIGGGDSVAAAKKFGLDTGVSYISTGGGAMLEYLEGKELPGIVAIAGE